METQLWDWDAACDPNASTQADSLGSSEKSQRDTSYHSTRTDTHNSRPEPPPSSRNARSKPRQRQYGPRTCRICLDTEYPHFPPPATTLGISTSSSKPTYSSSDPELGRLLSPCKCKGSQKYVHEGCLQSWRHSNPTAERNFWQCPTCKFTYRMTRLHWASMLSSWWAQILLTILVMVCSVFLLGFITDPLLDWWFDPVGMIANTVTRVVTDVEGLRVEYEESTDWTDHFLKGLLSLGVIGMVKAFVASPFQYYLNFRGTGLFGGGRRQGTGRQRYENMNFLFVLIGAFTFAMAVWKSVRSISAKVLQHVSDRVIDVHEDDDEDEADEDESEGHRQSSVDQ